MVIVLSALSVVAAAVLLGAWFLVGGGFALIYAAMALAVASMVLLWSARWIGSTPDAVAADGPVELRALASDTSLDAEAPRDPVTVSAGRPEPVPAAPGPEVAEPAEPVQPAATVEPTVLVEPAEAAATIEPPEPAVAPTPASAPATGADPAPAFPIEDYDTLWLSQILPLLQDLDDDELAMVDARERGGRHRAAVLDAIAARRPDTGGAGVRAARPEPGAWEQGPGAGPVAPLADLDLDLDETSGSEPEPEEIAPAVAEVVGDAETSGPEPVEDEASDVEPAAEAEADGEPASDAAPDAGDLDGVDLDDPFGVLDAAAQAEEDRLWAAAVPLLEQGRDPFLDDDEDAPATAVPVTGDHHDDWDVAEPDQWDWSGVRPTPVPLRSIEAVDLTVDPDVVLLDEGPDPDGSPRVRTFLGRRRSPVTVRRG